MEAADCQGLPWPRGDPEALRAIAARWRIRGQAVSDHAAEGAALGQIPDWQSEAAEKFGERASALRIEVERVERDVCTVIADLYQVHARALDESQQEVLVAAAKLREMREATAEAERRAAEARQEAEQAQKRLAVNPTLPELAAQAAAAAELAQQMNARAADSVEMSERAQRRASAIARAAVDRADRADRNTEAAVAAIAVQRDPMPPAPPKPYGDSIRKPPER